MTYEIWCVFPETRELNHLHDRIIVPLLPIKIKYDY